MGVPKQTTTEVDVLSSPGWHSSRALLELGGEGWPGWAERDSPGNPVEATGRVFEGAEFGVVSGTGGEEAGGEPLPRLQVPFQSLS